MGHPAIDKGGRVTESNLKKQNRDRNITCGLDWSQEPKMQYENNNTEGECNPQ